MLCWLGMHKWGRWVVAILPESGLTCAQTRQYRRCLRCCKTRTEYLHIGAAPEWVTPVGEDEEFRP